MPSRFAIIDELASNTKHPSSIILKDESSGCVYVASRIEHGFTIVDYETYTSFLSKGTWRLIQGEYVYNTGNASLHSVIMGIPIDKKGSRSVEPGVSIDHINQVPYDNRKSNLRFATLDDQLRNRKTRVDKEYLPDEISSITDTMYSPPYVRYDKTEGKYEFHKHPRVVALNKAGVVINATGTKREDCDLVDKYADTLVKYIDMHKKYADVFPDEAEEEDAFVCLRRSLLDEYFEIMDVLHTKDAEWPCGKVAYAGMFNLDNEYAEIQLQKILKNNKAIKAGGPKHLPSMDVSLHGCSIRKKGDYTTVYDTKHAAQLAKVNWDADDLRIHISPKLKTVFPLLESYQGKKIMLADFVYWILEGNTIPEGMTVATVNLIRHDVRASNLMLVANNGRGQKPPGDTRPDPNLVGDLGMEFLPRGVSIVKDRSYWMFLVKIKGLTDKKFNCNKENAKEVFSKVIAYLRQHNPGFQEENDKYQELSRSFYAIKKATESTLDGDAQV